MPSVSPFVKVGVEVSAQVDPPVSVVTARREGDLVNEPCQGLLRLVALRSQPKVSPTRDGPVAPGTVP